MPVTWYVHFPMRYVKVDFSKENYKVVITLPFHKAFSSNITDTLIQEAKSCHLSAQEIADMRNAEYHFKKGMSSWLEDRVYGARAEEEV